MIQTTLRLPPELYSAIKALAKKKGMTFNSLVVSVLWEIARSGGELFGVEERQVGGYLVRGTAEGR